MNNDFLIGVSVDGEFLQVMRPIAGRIPRQQALELAVLITILLNPDGSELAAIRERQEDRE